MTVLTKDQIKDRKRTPTQPVEAPERGGTLYIRQLSWGEVQHINGLNVDAEGNEDHSLFPARIFAVSVVDPKTGENLFTLDEVEDINELPFTLLQRVTVASCDLSGISQRAVEDMQKNLLTGPRDDSNSD